MKKDFDFESIGKRTPYVTPDHFFEEMQQKVFMETSITHRRNMRRIRMGIISVLSLAAAWMVGVWLFPSLDKIVLPQQPIVLSSESVATWIQHLSDEELEEFISCSENDIFLLESQS